nr:hypothetical protein CFP56_16338 [Quercus suber]
MTTFSRPSSLASSAAVSAGAPEVVSCYKFLAMVAEGSVSCGREVAATMHHLAVDWHPRISRISLQTGISLSGARKRRHLLRCGAKAFPQWQCRGSTCSPL